MNGALPSIVIVAVLSCVWGLPLAAQLPGPADPPAADEKLPSEEEILDRRDELKERLEALSSAGQAPESPAAETAVLLERIDRLLSLQLGELRRGASFTDTKDAGHSLLDAGLAARLDHPPPYSVGELDDLLDALEATRAEVEVLDRQVGTRLRALDNARDQLEDRGRQLRSMREDGTAATGSEALRTLELEHRLAEEQLALRRLQLRNDRLELDVLRLREEALARKAVELREDLQVDPSHLEATVAEIAAEREEIAVELDAAHRQTRAAEAEWSRIEDESELAGTDDPLMAVRLETGRLELDVAQAHEELLNARSEQLLRAEELWRSRYEVLLDRLPAGHRGELESRLEDSSGDLERERQLLAIRIEERRLAAALTASRRRETGDPPIRPWLARQEDALAKILAEYEEQQGYLDRSARLHRRVLADLREDSLVDVSEQLARAWQTVTGIWRYEIATAEDRPITVGKVILAVLLMILGYLASKILSLRLGRSVFPRLGLASGASAAFQTLIFYFLLVVFAIWALHLVSIPLTVFTVLGGVVAIGVGFGSQNIVNNFISGLIILAERPVKVGDLIDVDGVFGQVERIGPRSSRVRSGDNTHIIVPNSVFLENNVLNWTVSDDVLRSYVDIGVAYGSPVRKVSELLERAIDEEPVILDDPRCEVLFMDFGDNALAFRAYFWMRVQRPLDRFRAQSALRFRIDALFAEAGIVIAFPQRDIHLDTLSPLDVRLVSEGETPGDGETSSS